MTYEEFQKNLFKLNKFSPEQLAQILTLAITLNEEGCEWLYSELQNADTSLPQKWLQPIETLLYQEEKFVKKEKRKSDEQKHVNEDRQTLHSLDSQINSL